MTTATTERPAAPVTTDTISGAFRRTAREHPDREALSDGVTTVTYAELDALTDKIARALTGRGLRPGDRLGVHVERSLATYGLFVAGLKAGLVLVPFNTSHPADHKARMCRVAEPALTVIDGPAEGITPGTALPLAELLAAADALPAEPLSAEVSADSPAFVLFTSGSTGDPKGVVIAHRGIARVARHLTGFTPGPQDRFLQLAQPSFAASTTDIWTCLLRGGRLTVPPQEVPPLGELARLIRDEGTTVLNLSVGLFKLLAEHHPQTLAQARSVIVSGDFPSVAHLRRALDVMDGDLFNAFGCTENSALTAVHRITEADLADAEVPVGAPMPTVQLTVRDEDLGECPPGVVGELCIVGDGVALGYLGDPELTARKFTDLDGRRLLRTGDLAKSTEDGEIVLAGRTDQMIKVRGFRVEPRAVEVTAEELRGVQRAVVQAAPSDGAAEQLVLWCVLDPGHGDVAREIEPHLRNRLPDYMVPSTITVLDAFPLNTNGKLDRKALAASLTATAPGTEPAAAPERPVAPAGGGDRLAGIVRDTLGEVLQRDDLGVDDGLLESGATSLDLIDLGARLEDVTGVSLGPDDLAAAGTVRGVAEAIRGRRARG
jgi:amino acid adenylation domain-containing protein